MQKRLLLSLLIVLSISSCRQAAVTSNNNSIEVQGHRGDRGNYPENSIPAFISAVKKGADVIELDVVISRDRQVVVSHEPFMSSQYVSTPNGDAIVKASEKSYNLYKMDYDSIRKYDIGSKGNSLFPDQKKIASYKPLLSEAIDSVENFITTNKLKPVRYNIEIKSGRDDYDTYQPQPKEFVELVVKVVNDKGIKKKINIQSFDPAILNALHTADSSVKTAFLTGSKDINKNLKQLNYVPEIYSPHHGLVNAKFIDSLHAKNMRVIPWTVNETEDIEKMILLKVDGIITDYPEKVVDKLN